MDIFGIRFKATFGFRPSRVWGMFDHEQELVNATLTGCADSFRIWAEEESAMLKTKPSKGKTLKETRKNLQAHAQSLRDTAQLLRTRKDQFWRAHNLASNRGYQVLEKYTDYLPAKVH